MDTITLNFADLELRARFKTVPPPPWAFWLPQPRVTETAPAAAPVLATAPPEVALASAPATPEAPSRSVLGAPSSEGQAALPETPALFGLGPGGPSLEGARPAPEPPGVRPGIPPFDAGALPTRPELARPLLRGP